MYIGGKRPLTPRHLIPSTFVNCHTPLPSNMSVPAASSSTPSTKKAPTKSKGKSTTAKAVKPTSSKKSSTGTGLPPYRDLIKEAIAAHPDDARSGISRAQIKKFVEEKYNVEVTPAVNTHINAAIARGAEKGDFVLPKG